MFHDALERLVKLALSHLALHVGILVLNRSAHDRIRGIHKIRNRIGRCLQIILHELRLRQSDRFHGMGGQEAVLNIQKRSRAVFSRSPRNEAKVRRFLRVPGEEHAPPAVNHAHDIVMTGVNIERMNRQRASADIENRGKSLASDRIQNFLHQQEALT